MIKIKTSALYVVPELLDLQNSKIVLLQKHT